MFWYLALACVALCVAYGVRRYRSFRSNLAAAQRSGIPYVCVPVYNLSRFWMITHRLWLPLIDALPTQWTKSWRELLSPDFLWTKKYDFFREMNSDLVLLVAPEANTLYVADADAVTQITTRRHDFPKPIWLYKGIDIYGKGVVSVEGAEWRHQRKITSPPFTERNNVLVWRESLQQAQSMLTAFLGGDMNRSESGSVWDVAAESMRLSLHVISRAGFGVHLRWPHEEHGEIPIPAGHRMTYKEALETLLHNLLVLIIFSRSFLKYSPWRAHRHALHAYEEWGQYMREMYESKRDAVRAGESAADGLDLMGALVHGAGVDADVSSPTDGEKAKEKADPAAASGLLTDEEIFGNAFVFILAGHETAANTIHFSLLFLALHPASQRRLQVELDSILGSRAPSEWDYDTDLPRLFAGMCGAVMNEELRLLPPVIGIPKCVRDIPQPLRVGADQFLVPAGSYVTLDTVATHTNPKYWPHSSAEDLASFRPERWLTQETSSDSPSLFHPPRGAYLPFSEGHRSCLGRRFAQVEILAVLAVIFQRHSVELDVTAWMSDEEYAKASREEKHQAWGKAQNAAETLLRDGMGTVITLQMRGGRVPLRVVQRGKERWADCGAELS